MGKCDTYCMRFPGGKAKALTFSYDDGIEQDIRLIEILKANGMKATFNICSGRFAPEDTVYPQGTFWRPMKESQCVRLYKENGMEVALHGLLHSSMTYIPKNVCVYEVSQDRINLERAFDDIIRGLAYPCGRYDDDVIEILKQCGIAYARTIKNTEGFELPEEWLAWHPTCHHDNPRLMELAKTFVEAENMGHPYLFYVWGHSYDYDRADNWHVIEEFAEYMGKRDDVWYATNMEIYDYVTAYRQLVFSMNGNKVYNPTHITLYFEVIPQLFNVKPGHYCVKPGETITLQEG